MSLVKADLSKRFVAHLIDAVIAALPAVLLFPFASGLGSLIGAAYLLVRDGILYELTKEASWRNRSIGKRLVNLQVARIGGGVVDLATSAKRNLPFVLGNLAAWMPFVLGPLLGLIGAALVVIEIVLVLTDPDGRRLGDRWAETQVVSD